MVPGSTRPPGEHAPVGAEAEFHVRQVQLDRDGMGRRGRYSGEIVVAHPRPSLVALPGQQVGAGQWPGGAACQPSYLPVQCCAMAPYRIRTFGDPVLKRRADEVTEIDGRIARLAEDMYITMKEAHGLGLGGTPSGRLPPAVRLRDRQERPAHDCQPGDRESGRGMGARGGLPVGPGAVFREPRPKHVHIKGLRPRRPRGVHRGGRAGGDALPARDGPPGRAAAPGVAR